MIKRIIFDIDGTLIQNVNFRGAITATLYELGIYSDDNVNNFLAAISSYEKEHDSYNNKDYIAHVGKHLNTDLNDEFLKIFFNNLRFVIPENYEEIKEILSYLSGKYELVLLSNYFEESQRNRLKSMGINYYFTEYYGEKRIKPNEEAYIAACGNHLPSECLIIGDTLELDVKKPMSLGMNAIWLSTKENSDEQVLQIKTIGELLECLEVLNFNQSR